MDVGRLSVGAEIQELLAALVKEEEKEDDVVARARRGQREERGGSLNLSIQPLFYIERKSLMISAAHHGVSDLSTRNQWKWIQIQEMECASFSAEEISNKPCGLSTDQSSTAWPLMSRKKVTMVARSGLVGTSIVPRVNERAIEAPERSCDQ